MGGLVEGVASATAPYMAQMSAGPTAAWREGERRKQEESERQARNMTESIAAAVRSAGVEMGSEGMGASPARFEELSSSEMTGLETLLGL